MSPTESIAGVHPLHRIGAVAHVYASVGGGSRSGEETKMSSIRPSSKVKASELHRTTTKWRGGMWHSRVVAGIVWLPKRVINRRT